MEKAQAFGARLKWARETAGLSVSQAANLAEIPQHVIQALEAGSNIILIPFIEALIDVYDVDRLWLLSGKEREISMPETPNLMPEDREKLRCIMARRRQE